MSEFEAKSRSCSYKVGVCEGMLVGLCVGLCVGRRGGALLKPE